MSLGKRRRPSMKRTTSVNRFAPDLDTSDEPPMPLRYNNSPAAIAVNRNQMENPGPRQPCAPIDFLAQCKLSYHNSPSAAGPKTSPPGRSRNTGDFSGIIEMQTAPFLRSCGLCSRRLNPGRDIFMFRGEIAFCSLECRQQLINQEERKEKCSISSMKKHSVPSTSAASGSSGAGEKVAAA